MSNPETALATRENLTHVSDFHAFSNINSFEQAQRMAQCLTTSDVVPEIYRGKEKIGNCMIALEMSNRIGANVLAVMQNLYIVHGKPAWSSQFLISCVNASRRFTPLRYRMTGEKDKDTWGCIAWAEDKTGEKLESPEVTIAMAKAEGWYQKNGSKWKTMPELMLRYRAATFFTRLYAPEITMGILTRDEVVDSVEIESEVVSAALPSFAPKTAVATEPQAQTAKEVVLGTPTPAATRKRRTAPPPHEKANDGGALGERPDQQPKASEAMPTIAEVPDRSFEDAVDSPAPVDPAREAALKAIHQAIPGAGVSVAQIESWLAKKVKNKETGEPITSLIGLNTAQMTALTKRLANSGDSVVVEIKGEGV